MPSIGDQGTIGVFNRLEEFADMFEVDQQRLLFYSKSGEKADLAVQSRFDKGQCAVWSGPLFAGLRNPQ